MNDESTFPEQIDYSQFKTIDFSRGRKDFLPPNIVGTKLNGESATVNLMSGKLYLLAFFDYGCNSCEGIWQDTKLRKSEIQDVEFVVVLKDLNRLKRNEDLSQGAVRVICSTKAWREYKIVGKSVIVIIVNGEIIAENVVMNFDHLKSIYIDAKTKLDH